MTTKYSISVVVVTKPEPELMESLAKNQFVTDPILVLYLFQSQPRTGPDVKTRSDLSVAPKDVKPGVFDRSGPEPVAVLGQIWAIFAMNLYYGTFLDILSHQSSIFSVSNRKKIDIKWKHSSEQNFPLDLVSTQLPLNKLPGEGISATCDVKRIAPYSQSLTTENWTQFHLTSSRAHISQRELGRFQKPRVRKLVSISKGSEHSWRLTPTAANGPLPTTTVYVGSGNQSYRDAELAK